MCVHASKYSRCQPLDLESGLLTVYCTSNQEILSRAETIVYTCKLSLLEPRLSPHEKQGGITPIGAVSSQSCDLGQDVIRRSRHFPRVGQKVKRRSGANVQHCRQSRGMLCACAVSLYGQCVKGKNWS